MLLVRRAKQLSSFQNILMFETCSGNVESHQGFAGEWSHCNHYNTLIATYVHVHTAWVMQFLIAGGSLAKASLETAHEE